jgi:hypothetical protein
MTVMQVNTQVGLVSHGSEGEAMKQACQGFIQ